mmetsp:Transcript_15576/g.47335  ORF Transcript_15576/g.47335 Transcript_15576/m.47335 type:complete len:111 (-) Transcript_15576:171-503(-)|eukprot:scaffold65453_cov36-Tisochrysis_lutea.AAC.4
MTQCNVTMLVLLSLLHSTSGSSHTVKRRYKTQDVLLYIVVTAKSSSLSSLCNCAGDFCKELCFASADVMVPDQWLALPFRVEAVDGGGFLSLARLETARSTAPFEFSCSK